MSRYALETPVPLADLIALSPGYRVLPDLATVPYALRHMRFVLLEAVTSDRMFKRGCRLCDVKRVTASCHNDIMISYKSSRSVGNFVLWQFRSVLWLPTAN